MGLKLTIFEDDVIMMSDGSVILIEQIDKTRAFMIICNGDKTEESITRLGDNIESDLFEADANLRQIYQRHGRLCVEIEVNAEPNIKIHRFHSDDSDDRLVRLLAKFGDEKDEVIATLTTLNYELKAET